MSRRDEVLAAALELLDEVGLAALTVRRLAERLGVRPGALYRHFDSKAALLEAMVDHLIASRYQPDDQHIAETDWATQLRTMAEGARRAMLAHRDGALLMITHLRPVDSAAAETWREQLDRMTAAGLMPDTAESVVDTVFAFTNGFTMEEQARDDFPRRPERGAWRDAGFHAGLELILDGIRAQLVL